MESLGEKESQFLETLHFMCHEPIFSSLLLNFNWGILFINYISGTLKH